MTRDARRSRLLTVVGYTLGVLWLFAGLAVLVSIPVAAIVGAWVLGNALLTWVGVL